MQTKLTVRTVVDTKEVMKQFDASARSYTQTVDITATGDESQVVFSVPFACFATEVKDFIRNMLRLEKDTSEYSAKAITEAKEILKDLRSFIQDNRKSLVDDVAIEPSTDE